MLTALTILLLVVLLALTVAAVVLHVREGGFWGFYWANQALQGFVFLATLLLDLLASVNRSDG